MDKLNVKRSNKMLGMLFDEWKHHTNEGRPLSIKWNIMHMYSSSQLAKLHAIKNGLDIELCSLIAILHDIAVVEGKFRKDHDSLAGSYVSKAIERYNKRYLQKGLGINAEEELLIIEAISTHSDKENFTELVYSEMLKDIDSLDRYLYGIETNNGYQKRVKDQIKNKSM